MKKETAINQPQSNSNIWYDTQILIKSFIDALPEGSNESYSISKADLSLKLEQQFKGKHNVEEVLSLLKNGFEVTPGIYLFKLRDFKVVHSPVFFNPNTPKLWKPTL